MRRNLGIAKIQVDLWRRQAEKTPTFENFGLIKKTLEESDFFKTKKGI